jgi:broad specificity phosphatase PhoE
MTNAACSLVSIFLVRHGQSVANAGGITEDHVTNPLTELGRMQSRDFAAKFSHPVTHIAHSTFVRDRETAQPLLAKFPTVPAEDWPIHEFTYLEPARFNRTTSEYRLPFVHEYWEQCDPLYRDGQNAESFSSFLNRVRGTIQRLAIAAPGDSIVLFTHSLWMHAFRLLLSFPHTSDAELMSNFRRLYLVNPIRNLGLLKFEALKNQVHPFAHRHPNAFTLQGATSHE